jgi:hypothetical protein
MGASLFATLFPSLHRTPTRAAAPRRRSASLGLEALEDRTVPTATTTVLGLGSGLVDAGTVTVEAFDNDNDTDIDQIVVTYQTTAPYLLQATNLWIGDLSLNSGPFGTLPMPVAPGLLPFQHTPAAGLNSATDSFLIAVPDDTYFCDDIVAVVAHATLSDAVGNPVGNAYGVGTEIPSEAEENANFFEATLTCEAEEGPFEGLSHGFWKKHLSDWQGYSTSQTIASAFGPGYQGAYGNTTLLQALSFKGGTDVNGAERILLRNAVGSLLNATHANVNYQLAISDVISQVNTAINTHDRATMLALEAELDVLNNQEGDINS